MTSLLVDAEGIHRVYGGRPPALASVRLHAVSMDGFGVDPVLLGRAGSGVELDVRSDVVRLRAVAEIAHLTRISAYASVG
ncbi:hypothetical protein ACFY7C_26795 [Streptomyces sp. NPDC012769]|uniref:hypothetical protein n=1 Tax=Streptomyces sp. NPDC012769 TaxID=3364848 RepID=UPI00368D45B9